MRGFNWKKSVTILGTLIIAAAHGLAAVGKITPEQAGVAESVGVAIAGVGVRRAIAKNGNGN